MAKQLLAATRKGLFILERSGGRDNPWAVTRTAFLGDHLTMVLPDPRDGTLHASLYHGHFGVKMQRSKDGGTTWQEMTSPAYPQPQPGDEHIDAMGRPIQWKLDRVWALEAGLADQAGLLWCGTLPGGLFRSRDGGSTWELVRSLWDNPQRKEWMGGGADLPGIHSICVNPRDGRNVKLGVSCGGVWETTDGGETWACRAEGMRAEYMPPDKQYEPNIQDAHRVVQCASQPDHLWAQHHNGVFRSVNGSASWTEIKDIPPSVFGFAVAVHPKDPLTAWFVPAIKDERRVPVDGRVVVSRTRDGGKSFEVLRKGLPQEHAYDLTYRHGLDVDGSGNSLAFGSTTGSLWTSDDGGDSWQTISEHLPPIYCVRFVKS